jgi:hypothetical protein
MSFSERSRTAVEYRVSTLGKTTEVSEGVANEVAGTRTLTAASDTDTKEVASLAYAYKGKSYY